MIASDLGRILALGSVPVAYALGRLGLLQLFLVSLFSGVLTVFFDIAYQSYLPSLVGREHLVEGNAKLAGSAQSQASAAKKTMNAALSSMPPQRVRPRSPRRAIRCLVVIV